jgi:hypothetical protein
VRYRAYSLTKIPHPCPNFTFKTQAWVGRVYKRSFSPLQKTKTAKKPKRPKQPKSPSHTKTAKAKKEPPHFSAVQRSFFLVFTVGGLYAVITFLINFLC